MNTKRLELQSLLESIPGVAGVYFQPPENIRMKYPAIVYARNRINNNHADNLVYSQSLQYELKVIDADPDSGIVETVSKLPRCKFDRHYKADNLNHDIFTIYW